MSGGVITAGIIQALGASIPTSVIAGATIYALNSWQRQIREERRIERAEACLLAADEVVRAIRTSRVHVITASEEEAATVSTSELADRHTREWLGRAMERWSEFERAYRRASFFIELPASDREVGDILGELRREYRLAVYWESMRGGVRTEQHARDKAAKHRGRFLGLPSDDMDPSLPLPEDPIERRLTDAMIAIEDALLPVMGGKKGRRLQ